MGFRADLDLTDIVKDYEAFGGTAPRPATAIPAPRQPDYIPDLPVRQGQRDKLLATSHMGLQPYRPIIWDVNGYYAALGVPTDATRKQLREAYQALRGDQSVYLTYVFSQLLNEAVRAAYDATPLGERFIDRYVEEELKKRAAEESGRRASRGTPVDAADILDEWGYTVIQEETSSDLDLPDQVDNEPEPDQDWRYQEIWGWAYYLWRTWSYDISQLRTWQSLLAAELSVRGATVRFAVGISGDSGGAIGFDHEDHFIFFIPVGVEPTEEMASAAIDEHFVAKRPHSTFTRH